MACEINAELLDGLSMSQVFTALSYPVNFLQQRDSRDGLHQKFFQLSEDMDCMQSMTC